MITKIKKLTVFASTLCFILVIGINSANAQRTEVSFQVFYDQLSPYGDWIHDQEMGYLWLPRVASDFQPYSTNGHWVNTQYGNTWYSNYEWGWAPFHYGRWFYSNHYGWAWVPGYEWAPAWVSWREGGGLYGWAPLGPGMSFSINVNIPMRHWVFVPQRYFFHSNLNRYYRPRNTFKNFYNRTTIINNVYVYNNHNYYSGPDRRALERATRNRVVVHELKNTSRPTKSTLSSRTLTQYRPSVSRNNSNARPGRVVNPSNSNANISNVRSSRTQPTNVVKNKTSNNQTVSPSRSSRTSPSTNSTTRKPVAQRSTSAKNENSRPAVNRRVNNNASQNTRARQPTRPSRVSAGQNSKADRTVRNKASSQRSQVRQQRSQTPRAQRASNVSSSRSTKTESATRSGRQR